MRSAQKNIIRLDNTSDATKLVTFAFELCVLFVVSTAITYFFLHVLHLNWQAAFAAITISMVASGYILNYFSPLRYIVHILHDIQRTQIFNISLFASSNLFISWYMLYQQYGWEKTVLIGFGSPIAAGFLGSLLAFLLHA